MKEIKPVVIPDKILPATVNVDDNTVPTPLVKKPPIFDVMLTQSKS